MRHKEQRQGRVGLDKPKQARRTGRLDARLMFASARR